jgi:mannose-6-phosphate isomerase-like protein (cupin superfamily)
MRKRSEKLMHTPSEEKDVLRPPTYIGGAARTIMSLPFSELKDGKYNPEPLKTLVKNAGVPASILVDKNVLRGTNEAEIHRHEADLWIAIDGKVYFQVGGNLVDPYPRNNTDGTINDLELKAKEIAGGEEYALSPGDVLYIPEGQPHVHWTDENEAGRLWIIKIPARAIFPLEKVTGWHA